MKVRNKEKCIRDFKNMKMEVVWNLSDIYYKIFLCVFFRIKFSRRIPALTNLCFKADIHIAFFSKNTNGNFQQITHESLTMVDIITFDRFTWCMYVARIYFYTFVTRWFKKIISANHSRKIQSISKGCCHFYHIFLLANNVLQCVLHSLHSFVP